MCSLVVYLHSGILVRQFTHTLMDIMEFFVWHGSQNLCQATISLFLVKSTSKNLLGKQEKTSESAKTVWLMIQFGCSCPSIIIPTMTLWPPPCLSYDHHLYSYCYERFEWLLSGEGSLRAGSQILWSRSPVGMFVRACIENLVDRF